jgi:glycosyltransferase involved in cell wall biosynthesis
LKILHVIASADPKTGGPIEGIFRQDDVTRSMGRRTLVTLDAPSAPFLKDLPFEVHALGYDKADDWRPHWLAHYGYTHKFVPWLRKHACNFDAVIVNGLWNFSASGAAVVLPESDVPYFVFSHGMMSPWFRKYRAKFMGKTVSWCIAEGRLLNKATSVLFTTEDERIQARGVYPFWNYRETVVGYGTRNPPKFNAQMEKAFLVTVPQLGGRPYLLFLGRIHPVKGLDLLIDAASKVDLGDLQIVIAGPEQDRRHAGALRAAIKRHGLTDRIHWAGMLSGDSKWGAFYGAEAFVLPSHQESFGIVVAEALACELPCLITDKVNIWHEVAAEGAGIVGADSVDGIAGVLAKWLSLPERDRRLMVKATRIAFERHFDTAMIAPRMISTMQGLLGSRASVDASSPRANTLA